MVVVGAGDRGFFRWRSRLWLNGVGLALFLVGTTAALANNYANPSYQRDNYRGAFAMVRAQSLPREALIYDLPSQITAVDYYGRNLPVPVFGLPVPLNRNIAPEMNYPFVAEDYPATKVKLTKLAGQYHGFWLLTYNDSLPWTGNWLSQRFVLVERQWFGGVHLQHFRPGPFSPRDSLPGGFRVDEDFGPLRLTQVRARALRPGRRLSATLLWRPTSSLTADYTISLQLFDRMGHRVAQVDGQPFDGRLPTSEWTPK